MEKYILRQRFFLAVSTLATLSGSFLSIVFIYAVQNLVDCMILGETEILYKMIILLIEALILNFILGYFSTLLEAKISQKLHLELKTDLFQVILSQKYKEFKKTSIGLKLSIFENDINFIEEYYFNNIFVLIRNVIILVVSVTYLFTLNILMGIFLLTCTVIILSIPLLFGKNIDPIGKEYSDCKGKFISQLKDYCEGMDVIHVYNIEKYVLDNYAVILRKLENKLFQLRKKIGLYNQTMVTGNHFIIALSFSMGGFFVIKNIISVGELIAITQIINIIMQPMGEMASALVELNGSLAVRQKLEDILEKKQESAQEVEYPEQFFSGIECKDISYNMDDGTFSLNNITMILEPKKKYVIVGPSGCGKTTLLKLIADVIESTSGNMYINSLNYNESEKLVKQMVSLVHQDTFIFNDTIENNILLYQEYSPELFDNAVSITGLEKKLKEKIQIDCLENGSNLSGGEKQKIALARAILRNTPVLLLDEVTSALDSVTTKKVLESLFELEDKTIIFVTHKMDEEFLKKADCIICMNEGTIIETGPWDELINEKGYFYKLYAVGEVQ